VYVSKAFPGIDIVKKDFKKKREACGSFEMRNEQLVDGEFGATGRARSKRAGRIRAD
jgi:hypothetical protein